MKAPTQQQAKLLARSELIRAKPPASDELAFNHSVLCQIGLPRREVKGHEFLRSSGAAWLHVQAGLLDFGDGPVRQPVPYGAMPRLALIWVTSLAKRLNTPEIPIGRSAADFLHRLGYDNQGHRYHTLRQQLHALAACRLQLGLLGRTFNDQPVAKMDAWLPAKRQQSHRWPGTLILSADFFEELSHHAVPLDARALHTLRGSALALDIYAWLAHRLHRLDHKPLWLSWHALKAQFGHEYAGTYALGNFKRSFTRALLRTMIVYPDRVEAKPSGLELHQSPPPVPQRILPAYPNKNPAMRDIRSGGTAT